MGILDEFIMLLIALPILPFWGTKTALGESDSKLGNWESVRKEPGQPTVRLRFTYGGDHLGQGRVHQEVSFVRAGHYRFEDGVLHTSYEKGDEEASFAVQFECDALLIGRPKPVRLRARYVQSRAYPPLVGRWLRESREAGPDVWDFRPNGTFQEERRERKASGDYKKAKDGVDVTWNVLTPGQEHWRIRKSNGSLFVTSGTGTIEYKPRLSFE